jgi:hypothetical protein
MGEQDKARLEPEWLSETCQRAQCRIRGASFKLPYLTCSELKYAAELRLGHAQRLAHAPDGIGHGNTVTFDILVKLTPPFTEIICGRGLCAGHELGNLSQLGNGVSQRIAPTHHPLDDLSIHTAFHG